MRRSSTAHEVGVAPPPSIGGSSRPLRLLGMRLYQHDRPYVPMVYGCLQSESARFTMRPASHQLPTAAKRGAAGANEEVGDATCHGDPIQPCCIK